MANWPNPRDYLANWRESDLPLDKKVAAVLRNNLKKLRTASSCCGNHGEPGC